MESKNIILVQYRNHILTFDNLFLTGIYKGDTLFKP